MFNSNGVSEYHFDTNQISLRPFTTLLWRYDLTLADGSTTQSQTMSVRYDDNRFAWQDLESGPLRIHWYSGGDQFGASPMNAAQAGLQSVNNFFVPNLSEPVDIYIYASQNDLLGTLPGAESWIAGHADSPAGVVMVTVEPGANQNILMEQRIPHELMHVLLYRQVGDGYRNLPAWFREGMSVAAEVYPNPDHDSTLKDAAGRDAVIPILDLCDSLSPQADSAFLAYAESGSFINYLRGQFGSDGLMNLANTYASDVDCEPGMERAFNVPFARLERDWQRTLTEENNILSDLGDLAPYLALLCLVMFFPLMGILGSLRKKGQHGK
jgi:hypothetical protein